MKNWLRKKISGKETLFKPIVGHLYHGLSLGKGEADEIYFPAFDRIFLQLKAFSFNGLKGDILEFGVLQGYTAKIIADRIKRFRLGGIRLHLFDSFEGLPATTAEDNLSYECQKGFWIKGAMEVPKGTDILIEEALSQQLGEGRVCVVKGYFEEKMEHHIREQKIEKAALVNLDCDLYSSSKYVLHTLFEYDLTHLTQPIGQWKRKRTSMGEQKRKRSGGGHTRSGMSDERDALRSKCSALTWTSGCVR